MATDADYDTKTGLNVRSPNVVFGVLCALRILETIIYTKSDLIY